MNRQSSARLGWIPLLVLLIGASFPVAEEVEKGNEAWRRGEYEAAERHYNAAGMHLAPEGKIPYNRGTARYRKGDFAGAAEEFSRATERDAGNPDTWYNLGNSLFRQEKLPDAIAAYRQGLERAPDDEDLRYNLEQAEKKLRMRQQKAARQQKKQCKESQENNQQQGAGNQAETQDGSSGQPDENPQTEPKQADRQEDGQSQSASAEDQAREAAEQRQVDEKLRQLEQAQISENRQRRYLKELAEEDRQLSQEIRRRMMRQRRSTRSDPFDRDPFAEMFDPFGRREQPKVNTDEKDW